MTSSPHGPGQGPGYQRYQGQQYPPPREGMSTGAKIAIGCGVAVLVLLVAAAIFVFFAGRFISEQIGGFGAQGEATETFERLAEAYPFTPPEDGVVTEQQAWTFFNVSDEVWSAVAEQAEELNRLIEEAEASEEEPGFRDLITGMEAMGKLFRARLVLAEALERHQISSQEYTWTGHTLMQAYRALTEAETESDVEVPDENIELARRHQVLLADFAGDHDRIGKEIIFLIGMLGMEEDDWESVYEQE